MMMITHLVAVNGKADADVAATVRRRRRSVARVAVLTAALWLTGQPAAADAQTVSGWMGCGISPRAGEPTYWSELFEVSGLKEGAFPGSVDIDALRPMQGGFQDAVRQRHPGRSISTASCRFNKSREVLERYYAAEKPNWPIREDVPWRWGGGSR